MVCTHDGNISDLNNFFLACFVEIVVERNGRYQPINAKKQQIITSAGDSFGKHCKVGRNRMA